MGRHRQYSEANALESAMNLFWQHGYDSTSLKEMENALDMRPGSIYKAFGSKEKLYLRSLELYVDITGKLLKDSFLKGGFYQGLIDFLYKVVLQNKSPIVCMLGKSISEGSPKNLLVKKQANSMVLLLNKSLIEQINKSKNSGEISNDISSETIASMTISMIFGIRAYCGAALGKREARILIQTFVMTLKTSFASKKRNQKI